MGQDEQWLLDQIKLHKEDLMYQEVTMEYRKIYEKWISSPHISEEEKAQLRAMSNEDIYEAFYKYAEFGTAGMRGIMGLGTNRLNKYTIRMAAKGMAELLGENSKVAIAYDTRNHSKEFAEESARVLAAAGIKALIFDCYSPVPLLSYAVRQLNCDGGIVITASHNTMEYNGFKVYDNTGCQMNTGPAGKIADNMARLEDELSIPVAELDDSNIQYIGKDIITSFLNDIEKYSVDIDAEAAKDLKIIYTSLHGSGRDFVLEALKNSGFENVTIVQEQADFNGDFPTVKKPNPEDKAAFTMAEKLAVETDADILIGTDPDCDRIGVGVKRDDRIVYFSGNQMGALLIDFLGKTGNPAEKTLITTIVTGEMGPAVAEDYGVNVIKTLTGFKNIGTIMNGMTAGEYFMGYEESYGYLVGEHARDKDGVGAALAICKMAAYYKAQGQDLEDALSQLYEKHGHWLDQQESFTFEGSEGEKKIRQLMETLKTNGESELSKVAAIKSVLDYNNRVDGLEPANVLKYVFENGAWVAARPSGTEPKIKFYYCVKGDTAEDAQRFLEALKNIIAALI